MTRTTILLFACVFSLNLYAQRSYTGASVDFNSGLGQKFCYGVGINHERSFGKEQRLYFNWHYTFGSSTHLDPYVRANASLLLYSMDDWFDTRGEKPGAVVIALIVPAVCPIGFTFYSKPIRSSGLRLGFYCNPAAMDYWDQRPATVVSVTMEGGVKALWKRENNFCWYAAVGGCITNNISDRRGQRSSYGNENTLTIQLGFMWAKDE